VLRLVVVNCVNNIPFLWSILVHTLTNIILLALAIFAIAYATRNFYKGNKSEGTVWMLLGLVTFCSSAAELLPWSSLFLPLSGHAFAMLKQCLDVAVIGGWLYASFIHPARLK
jgi:hypothetical protein